MLIILCLHVSNVLNLLLEIIGKFYKDTQQSIDE